jgi:hypothetical protein
MTERETRERSNSTTAAVAEFPKASATTAAASRKRR